VSYRATEGAGGDGHRPRLTPELWREAEAIFLSARDQEPGERAAFLVQACATDALLMQEVESLLAADHGATGFLEPPTGPSTPELEGALTTEFNVLEAEQQGLVPDIARGGNSASIHANGTVTVVADR
jgi:hypothetical protein